MATLQISDDVEALLESASKRTGRTPAELAEEILHDHLQQDTFVLSPEQMERIQHSSEQIDRGEYVTSDHVDRFFDTWFRELKSR